jgi:tetratricopeptide (TPR) repeat protein
MTNPREALEYFRKAVALDETLLATDPANALTRKDLGYLHKRIADFLGNLNDNPEALLHHRKALEVYQQVVTDAPTDVIAQFLVATCRAGVAQEEARLGEVVPALQECRKAIAVLGEVAEDPTNARQRYNRAQAYESLGFAYLALATFPKPSANDTAQHMRAARDMYQQSLNVLDDLRSRGVLDAASEDWAKNIAAEIAKCDAALGKDKLAR